MVYLSGNLPYGVDETGVFITQASVIFGSTGKWDEKKRFIDLYLARDPSVGHRVPGTNLYALIIFTPPCVLFYTYDILTQGRISLVEIHKI
jgi:hypothetical protein